MVDKNRVGRMMVVKPMSVRVLVGRLLVLRMFVVRRVALHWMIRSLGVVKSRLVMVSAVSLVVGISVY